MQSMLICRRTPQTSTVASFVRGVVDADDRPGMPRHMAGFYSWPACARGAIGRLAQRQAAVIGRNLRVAESTVKPSACKTGRGLLEQDSVLKAAARQSDGIEAAPRPGKRFAIAAIAAAKPL